MVTAAYPNGLQSSFTWDSRHRLTALASPAASYSYALDPVGNRTSATETSGRTLSWSYDGVNRLTDESVAEDPAGRNGSVSYTLDPVGNRLAAASTLAGVASSSATYSPDDLLSTESYDLNGNVLSTGGKSFTYDSENRLVGMNGGGAGSQVAIQYDGWGNRVAETANGTTTRFLVDDLNPTGYPQVVEEVVNGTVTRQYTNGLERISEIQTISGKWTPSFYGYDGMGNVRQLSNLAGTITDNYEYDAFGNVILSTGNTPNNYLYRGEQYDATLGLQYLRARYYNPVIGRFLSKDPWSGTIGDPASLHKYSYAEANPIFGRDPSGLSDLVEVNVAASQPRAAGLRYVGSVVNCILNTAAGTLWAISSAERSGATLSKVNVDYSDCGGDASQGKEPLSQNTSRQPPTVAHCLGVAPADKGVSIGLDILGSIPTFGNATSATARILRAAIVVDHVITKPAVAIGSGVYGAYGAVTSGPEDALDSLIGGASAGAGIGLALADASLGGTKAIPRVGNAVSVLTLGWDFYIASEKYNSCIAGH